MKKKLFVAMVFAACFSMMAGVASAHNYDRDDDGHPLRIIAYAAHPFGMACEYVISRPIHWLVSKPKLNVIFGHVSYENDKLWGWE